ncbi:MAG: hypothetical protein LWX11_09310 [Firmicutes bacterium]|nr:hypothetical protein [Bacillota bacterium]
MIPFALMPGFASWGVQRDRLLTRPEPLWVFGEAGCGVSTVGAEWARLRNAAFLDDADLLSEDALRAWLKAHPSGVLGSHQSPNLSILALRLPSLAEAPEAISTCLSHLAQEEGCMEPLPAALSLLPCPGNLRELRNRVVRWKLLGQLPEAAQPTPEALPLDSDDLAANLHLLERLLLHRALRRSYGNRVEAAQRLGVSRRQLYLLVARHGDPVRGEPSAGAEPKRLRNHRR